MNTRTAKAQVASAKAQLDSAEQQLKSVELLLEQLTIKSPVSGIVGQKYYENGEYVKENEKILTLIDTSSVDAVIYIQEKELFQARFPEVPRHFLEFQPFFSYNQCL